MAKSPIRAFFCCLATVATVCSVMLGPWGAQAQETGAPVQDTGAPIVVELFTSQACSSCPPADRFLAKLAERENIIAISMPVDYWDHLDWKDTLGRAEHSERQRHYARHLGHPNVFTPQIVVNGHIGVIGSRVEAVEAAIRTARDDSARVPVEISLAGEEFRLRIGAAKGLGPANILVVPLLSTQTVAIKRGENRGKTITYHNVSRELMSIGTWTGEAKSLTLAHDEVMVGGADRCAVILQDARTGVILAAALLEGA